MYDISAIKKLPAAERLKIIDELWDSLEQDGIPSYTEKEEEAILQERINKYEKGEMKFDSWDNVRERLNKRFGSQ